MADQRVPLDLSVGGLSSFNKELRELSREFRQFSSGFRQFRVSGPAAQFQRAQRDLIVAQAAGNPVARFDAAINFRRAQARFNRAQGSGLGSSLMDAFSTSRVGFGASGMTLMPLVNRLAGVLEALPGPVGAVVKGFLAVAAGTNEAVKALSEFNAAVVESGGRGRDIGGLTALGVPGGSIAGIAAGLRSRLATDPYAMRAGAQLGVGPVAPRPFGPANEAKILMDTLSALRRVTNAEERLTLARQLGVESMLSLLDVSDSVFKRIQVDAQVRERIMDPSSQTSANDAMAGLRRIGEQFMNLVTAVFKPAVTIAGPILNSVADVFRLLADATNLINTPLNEFLGIIKKIYEFLHGGAGGESSLDANTRAVSENTRTLRSFGGGPRTGGAFPLAWRGMMRDQAAAGGAGYYGAWALQRGL